MLVSLTGCGRANYQGRDAGLDASADAFSETDSEANDAALDAMTSDDDANLDGGVDAGRDAGRDAGSDAGPPDARIVSTCPRRAEFCDGYDDGFSAWDFSVTNGGSVSRALAPVHSGTGSLRCVSDGGSSVEARYSVEEFRGQVSGDLWARAFFYLPATLPDTSIISLSDLTPPYTGVGVQIAGGRLGVSSSITSDTAFDPMPIPREVWVCVEFHVVAGATGVLEAYRDGALVARASGFNTVPDTGYEVAEIGIHFAPSGPAFELYVDDVALGEERLGCL